MGLLETTMPEPVPQRADYLWQNERSPPGRDEEFWLRAEAIVAANAKPGAMTPVQERSPADVDFDEALSEMFPASDPAAKSDAGQIQLRIS